MTSHHHAPMSGSDILFVLNLSVKEFLPLLFHYIIIEEFLATSFASALVPASSQRLAIAIESEREGGRQATAEKTNEQRPETTPSLLLPRQNRKR